jgi:hypothetical protein
MTMRLRFAPRASRGAQQQQRGHIDRAHNHQQSGHAHENDERLLQIDAAG